MEQRTSFSGLIQLSHNSGHFQRFENIPNMTVRDYIQRFEESHFD